MAGGLGPGQLKGLHMVSVPPSPPPTPPSPVQPHQFTAPCFAGLASPAVEVPTFACLPSGELHQPSYVAWGRLTAATNLGHAWTKENLAVAWLAPELGRRDPEGNVGPGHSDRDPTGSLHPSVSVLCVSQLHSQECVPQQVPCHPLPTLEVAPATEPRPVLASTYLPP